MLKHLFLLWVLLSSTLAQAKLSHVETYTLDDCIAIALQKHQSLKVSDAQVAMAEALYQQAMSAYWPRLAAKVSADRADEDRTFNVEGSFSLPQNLANGLGLIPGVGGPVNSLPLDLKIKLYDRDLVRASINLTYPVFSGFKRPAIVGQAEKGVQIAEQGRRKTSLEVVRDVKKYYYAAQFALQMEQLAADTLERFKVLEDLTERLYQNGSLKVKKTDYLRTKTITALNRSMLNEAVYARELAHEALGNAMGQAWDAQYHLAESQKPVAITTELQELIDAANHFNPELQQLSLAVQLAEHRITEAQSGYYPMIGVQARAYKLWNGFDGGLINDDNRDGWNIGVGMQWDLFSGFETAGKVNHAKAQQRQIKSQRVLLDEGMALQIKQQFLRIRSSGKQIKNTESAYGSARENRQLHIRAYRQEMVETKDVIQAQLVEGFAKSAYYRSRYALEIALTSLEYLIGRNIEHLSP
ncbi:MAG: TolC family protein [Methylococcaceae bacterium]|nr:TolC family protein [Methylococcaceae bacterium]